MSDSSNFLVNTQCPHCRRHLLVAISGFGGELAVRLKQCKHCNQTFYVQCLTLTTDEPSDVDGEIALWKSRIKYLQTQRQAQRSRLVEFYRQEQLASKLTQSAILSRKDDDPSKIN